MLSQLPRRFQRCGLKQQQQQGKLMRQAAATESRLDQT
jgi:hypothetical protein